MENAVNRGHGHVEESDILLAEKQYSQFALSTVVVENVVSIPDVESMLYEFAGTRPVVTLAEITKSISRANGTDPDVATIVEQLCLTTFFGIEIGASTFRYAEDVPTYKKLSVLAAKFQNETGSLPRYQINKAYWAFLEIQE